MVPSEVMLYPLSILPYWLLRWQCFQRSHILTVLSLTDLKSSRTDTLWSQWKCESLLHKWLSVSVVGILLLFRRSVVSDSVTTWTAACHTSLSITISWSWLKFMSIESVMPSNHLILCRPLLLRPSVFPRIRVFSNELALHSRWPKYWSFSFSDSPSNEYLGLISFRIEWFHLLVVQGTLKTLLQHHSLKASILWLLAFFMVQLSHPYLTYGKTIALAIQTFVSKVMSLVFNMLSSFIIAFLTNI